MWDLSGVLGVVGWGRKKIIGKDTEKNNTEDCPVESQVSEQMPVLTEPRFDSLWPKAQQHLAAFKLNHSQYNVVVH